MSEVVQETQRDFWRPPVVAEAAETVPVQVPAALADACSSCGAEFMIGSHFCHSCGERRADPSGNNAAAAPSMVWAQSVASAKAVAGKISRLRIAAPSWLHYLQFHEIKEWIGLPTASLIAFLAGTGCVVAAVCVGLMTARTFVDWQAIQFYRAEWLIGATAAFVAGILLKKSGKSEE